MTSPLERAARAYHDSTRQFRYVRDCLKPSAPPIARPAPFVEWDDLDDETRSERKKQVRAVLAAIREPTEAMADKGGASIAGQFTDPWDVLSPQEEEALGLEVDGDDAYLSANERLAPYATDAWQAMIDAALSEKL